MAHASPADSRGDKVRDHSSSVASISARNPLETTVVGNVLLLAAAISLTACGSGTGSRTPTATPTSMPSLTATPTATPTSPPLVAFDVQLDHPEGGVRITGRLTNTSDQPLFYLAGCSALCRPEFYRAVSFQVTGPDGVEVIVESSEYPYPCAGPWLCPEFPQQISPGEMVEETLSIDGIAWSQDSTTGGYCGLCTAYPFEAGRYQVTATASYSTASECVYSPIQAVRTSEFDWP
jgi:hypothetical protein